MKILITGVGAVGIVSILDALRAIKYHCLVGVDCDEMSVGKHYADRFYTVPHAHDKNYKTELAKICIKEKIDVALLLVDEEIYTLAGQDFPCAMSISNAAATKLCIDKRAFYSLLKHGRIKIPATREFEGWQYSEGEYILKPRFGRGSNGIHRVSSAADAEYFRGLKDYIVQEYVEGKEYTVDVLRNRQGEFLATVPRLRIMTDSGLSIKGKTVKDNGIIRRTQEVITSLGLWGAANVQWIGNRLIEVNPRIAGSVALSIAAGVNIPAEAARIFADKNYNGKKMNFKEVTMLRYWRETFEEG